jgi:endo-1,4-beta-xylanase
MRKLLMWIGAVVALAFIATTAALAVFAAASEHIRDETTALPSPAIKDLAKKKGLELGNYAALKRLGEQPYADILTSQFNFLTIDGEPNWQFNDGMLRPTATTFDFSRIDKVMDFAKQHNMPVQMHHLVWGEQKWLPEWLTQGKYNKEQLLDLIHQHIQTVAGHYKGQVREWTVVNEAFTRAQHLVGLNDWWGDHIGQDYIDQSFQWARQADPNAKLLMNDFDDEIANSVSDAMYTKIKQMKQDGVPIDGIGMQMHLDGNKPPDKQAVIDNMRRFGALGIGVYVTELDVTMNDFSGTQQEKEVRQAVVYHDMLRACIESGVCKSFALLGITDKETWYNELCCPASDPLPFDDNYQAKPAFWALREALLL